MARLIHPDKTEEHFERDAEGRLLTHTDALRQRTTWHYNEAGLIQQRQDANDTIGLMQLFPPEKTGIVFLARARKST